MSILFVCLGNICRSPLVAAVARQRFAQAGLEVEIDSCGTGDWHVGAQADARSITVAEAAGYRLRDHRARQLRAADYQRFDYVLAMDMSNLATLRRRQPATSSAHLALFLELADVDPTGIVPDPYTGDLEDFRAVLELAERGVNGLLHRWQQKLTGEAAYQR